ncbi:MAG: 50S ribosomal protein L25/general stress protein Ctc [Gammaproteobacteria bacterium]
MSVDFTLNAELRNEQELGKAFSRRLRNTGKVPAVMYGGGEEPVSIMFDHNKLMHSLEQEAIYSHILTIDVAGKSQRAILRDLQRHPYKPTILHMDLLRVREDVAINVHVPLHFLNEDTCPGVKLDGGVVSHNIVEVEISCLPKDLPEFIEVDVAELKLNDSLHLSDIKVPDGVTIVELAHGEDHDHVVVSIHVKRAVEEETVVSDEAAEGDEAAAEGDAAEGEDKSSGDDS